MYIYFSFFKKIYKTFNNTFLSLLKLERNFCECFTVKLISLRFARRTFWEKVEFVISERAGNEIDDYYVMKKR
jgi:hypothetical protein